MPIRSVVRLSLALLLLIGPSGSLRVTEAAAEPAQAAITAAADNRRKMNLVGRLGMLSQYLSRLVCYHSLGPHAAPHPNELGFASELFTQTLEDLRKGSPTQDIKPVTEPDIQVALDRTASIWKGFAQAVESRDLDAAIRLEPGLLDAAETTLRLLEARNKETGVAPGVAAAIRFGGLQRVRTQKATKEYCLVVAGRDVTASKQRLAATLIQIDGAQRSLFNVEGPSAGEISDQMAAVATQWAALRALLAGAVDGGSPTNEDLISVARGNAAVMKALSTLIEIYELVED